MSELASMARSLRAAGERAGGALELCAAYVEHRAALRDPLAQMLARELEEAFLAMRAEGVAAAAMIGDHDG